jgi:hypothetical protein
MSHDPDRTIRANPPRSPGRPRFRSVWGVDFSGAKLAGRNIWIARTEPTGSSRRVPPLRLVELHRLEDLCGTADRAACLERLVDLIAESRDALWGMDFPFGFPIEVMDRGCTWPGQLRLLREWGDDAYDLGLWCLERAKALGGPMHIKRTTDVEAKAPFDCYHYRIIYQAFYGMRDVLTPLSRKRRTAILPFQYARLPRAHRVVMESCPASTLKRLAIPHQNYKQPAGGRLTPIRLKTRRTIFARLAPFVAIDDRHRRVMMRNGGGDAIDAVIAAVGAHWGWMNADHAAIARHARYPREGYLYA